MAGTGDRTAGGGVRARLRRGAGRVFSPRTFLYALAATGGGFLVAGTLLPGWSITGVLGVLAGAFLLGLVRRGYVETVLAGATVAGVGALLDYLVFTILGGIGVPVAVLGVGAGGLAALVGHYLGRDLRDGLTREL